MNNLFEITIPIKAEGPFTATGNTAAINISGLRSLSCLFALTVGASSSFTAQLQYSNDGATFANVTGDVFTVSTAETDTPIAVDIPLLSGTLSALFNTGVVLPPGTSEVPCLRWAITISGTVSATLTSYAYNPLVSPNVISGQNNYYSFA